MTKLMLVAGLCAAAGLAHAHAPPNPPSTGSVTSGSIDGMGDISLKAPKYNLNLPEVVAAPTQGVDADAITAYRVSPPASPNPGKTKGWTFDGKDRSANSYIQDHPVGQLNVDGYDNTNNDPED